MAINDVKAHGGTCPNCGHCPHCGRSNFGPYRPYWVGPHWWPGYNPTWTVPVTTTWGGGQISQGSGTISYNC